MTTRSPPSEPDDVRATFQEYTIGSTRVATIADPENHNAWIQSTVTTAVEP